MEATYVCVGKPGTCTRRCVDRVEEWFDQFAYLRHLGLLLLRRGPKCSLVADTVSFVVFMAVCGPGRLVLATDPLA